MNSSRLSVFLFYGKTSSTEFLTNVLQASNKLGLIPLNYIINTIEEDKVELTHCEQGGETKTCLQAVH